MPFTGDEGLPWHSLAPLPTRGSIWALWLRPCYRAYKDNCPFLGHLKEARAVPVKLIHSNNMSPEQSLHASFWGKAVNLREAVLSHIELTLLQTLND